MGCRIGLAATGSRGDLRVVEAVTALSARRFPEAELVAHAHTGLVSGHFAGEDGARAQAFLDIANDPAFDALWILRGGYGANRLIELVLPELKPAAREKVYLGYSDAGFLLGPLYAAGFPHVFHGPMPQDILRPGGEAAVERALDWLVRRAPESLEPSVDGAAPTAAFNITILSHLLGTPWAPDLSGHVLMLEEVSEPMYRIDRALFHITSQPMIRRLAGLKLGRCGDIVPNDPHFGRSETEVARYWCERSGVAWLGRADIGHDVDNRIVPFGRLASKG